MELVVDGFEAANLEMSVKNSLPKLTHLSSAAFGVTPTKGVDPVGHAPLPLAYQRPRSLKRKTSGLSSKGNTIQTEADSGKAPELFCSV